LPVFRIPNTLWKSGMTSKSRNNAALRGS